MRRFYVNLIVAIGLSLFLVTESRADTVQHRSATAGVKVSLPSTRVAILGHPVRILSVPSDDPYAQMPDGVIRNVRTGKVAYKIPSNGEHQRDAQGAAPLCAATTGPRFACLVLDTDEHQRTLFLADSAHQQPQVLARRPTQNGNVEPYGIQFTSSGTPIFAWAESMRSGDAVESKQFLYYNDQKQEISLPIGSLLASLAEVGGEGRHTAPLQMIEFAGRLLFLFRDGNELLVHAAGREPVTVAQAAHYDIRALTTPDGWLYVLYHDPRDASAHVAVTRDGAKWTDLTLDSRESGWQLDAVVRGDSVYVVYYYFRNSYNKGLRVVALKGGRRVGEPVTVVREREFNTGWHPHLGISHDGTTWLTYLRNVESKERVWTVLRAPTEFSQHAIPDTGTADDHYKDYFLQSGLGGWLTWWHLTDGAPSTDATKGVSVGQTSYKINKALLATANLEARWGSIDVGLSYAQEFLDEAQQEVKDKTGIGTGNIKIEDVFPGHAVKLGFVWGRYRGTASAGENVGSNGVMNLKTDYIDTKFYLLNKWRMHYGLAYTRYRVPASIHVFAAGSKEKAYTYDSSHLRDTAFQDIDVMLGYSKLDYATQYENHYNDVFFDSSLHGGLTLYNYDSIETKHGSVSDGWTANLRLMARLGWLYFHRWDATGGLGLYLRPAYSAEYYVSGFLGEKPKDREDDATDDVSVKSVVALSSLRHGPWFDFGVVW